VVYREQDVLKWVDTQNARRGGAHVDDGHPA